MTDSLNRRFPAEWENQEGVLLCFPHEGKDWPGKYQPVQWALVEFIRKIAAIEKVFLVVSDGELQDKVTAMLVLAETHMANVAFIAQKTNRSWMRDSGPIIVYNNGKREGLNCHFNGWAKYPNWHLDRHIPEKVTGSLKIPLTPVVYKGKKVILEGGAIDSNGRGTLLTSEECLLDQRTQVRNPGFSKQDYESIFREYFGITHVIWVGKGIEGDDTHGHIDDLCRFVNETTIATVIEDNPADVNYQVLQDNLKRLQAARLENGQKPDIVTLPMPGPLVFERCRLPASYANFLIINHFVLVPTFNDVKDRIALNTLAGCFPGREVIGINAADLIWGFGTLHCLSQQIPS